METEKLIAVVTIILTLSIASERLVEIIKGRFPKFFGVNPIGTPAGGPVPRTEPNRSPEEEEARRKSRVSLLAVGCGIVTAFLASPILVSMFKDITAGSQCLKFTDSPESPCFAIGLNGVLLTVAMGLLASGGSALWNSILEYLLKIKDLKKIAVKNTDALGRVEVERAERALKEEKDDRHPLS